MATDKFGLQHAIAANGQLLHECRDKIEQEWQQCKALRDTAAEYLQQIALVNEVASDENLIFYEFARDEILQGDLKKNLLHSQEELMAQYHSKDRKYLFEKAQTSSTEQYAKILEAVKKNLSTQDKTQFFNCQNDSDFFPLWEAFEKVSRDKEVIDEICKNYSAQFP